MPKDRKPVLPKPVKNRKLKVYNHELETRTILVRPDLIPCGPAFVYDEGRKEVISVTINGYHTELVEIENGYFITKVYGYRCNQYNLSNYDKTWGFWPFEDVFPTKAEAEKQTKFTAVNLSNKVYQKALGIDAKGKRIQNALENCELPICCEKLSEVRDRLIECMERKGLEKWKIDLIDDYLHSSHPELISDPTELGPNLKQIFCALGLVPNVPIKIPRI